MAKTTATAIPPPFGRGSVTRLTDARRFSSTRNASEVTRARDARRHLRSGQERFAHLKRMYD